MDATGHFIFKTLPQCLSRVGVAYLIKDNALNDLCGKTLDISSFCSATKEGNILLRKYVFERHFDGSIKIMRI